MSTVSKTNPKRTAHRLARQISRLQREVTFWQRQALHWTKETVQAQSQARSSRRESNELMAIAFHLLQKQGGTVVIDAREADAYRGRRVIDKRYDPDTDTYHIGGWIEKFETGSTEEIV